MEPGGARKTSKTLACEPDSALGSDTPTWGLRVWGVGRNMKHIKNISMGARFCSIFFFIILLSCYILLVTPGTTTSDFSEHKNALKRVKRALRDKHPRPKSNPPRDSEHKNALKRALRDKNSRPKSNPPGTTKSDLGASEHKNVLKRAPGDSNPRPKSHHPGTTKNDLGASRTQKCSQTHSERRKHDA